ncbi:MAG: iron-sulfur cluster assembly accessory protein [Phycisphaerales bacterium]|nr:iron-sulfur cluster assembly accessory protein [Phycisphaerales bacterium]
MSATTSGSDLNHATRENSVEQAPAQQLSARSRARTPAEGEGVVLSDKAAETIKGILEKDNHPETMYLFVGVKGGGCSGFQYVLDLRDEAHSPVAELDEVFESHGITIVCDIKSYVGGALSGTTIDYQESLMGAGFVFNNPNAKHTCGCGSSYSA